MRRIAIARGCQHTLEVLEAQQQLYPAQNALAQSAAIGFSPMFASYKALGGGWIGRRQ